MLRSADDQIPDIWNIKKFVSNLSFLLLCDFPKNLSNPFPIEFLRLLLVLLLVGHSICGGIVPERVRHVSDSGCDMLF